MSDNENQLLALYLLDAELTGMKQEKEVSVDDLLVFLHQVKNVLQGLVFEQGDHKAASLCLTTLKLVASATRLAQNGYPAISQEAAQIAISHLLLRRELFGRVHVWPVA